MPPKALLFDLDGTLVDTTDAHTDAWCEAFGAFGYAPSREAVARAIGIGGDKLVAAVLGDAAEARDGDGIRERASAAYKRLTKQRRLDLFPRVPALLDAARARGLRLAIATAAKADELDALFESVGVDLREAVDAVTNTSDVEESKPAPDVLHAVLAKLGLDPREAVFVGDTPHDAEAAERAGVPFVGVATGAWPEGALCEAGARVAYPDAAALLDHLDEALGRP